MKRFLFFFLSLSLLTPVAVIPQAHAGYALIQMRIIQLRAQVDEIAAKMAAASERVAEGDKAAEQEYLYYKNLFESVRQELKRLEEFDEEKQVKDSAPKYA